MLPFVECWVRLFVFVSLKCVGSCVGAVVGRRKNSLIVGWNAVCTFHAQIDLGRYACAGFHAQIDRNVLRAVRQWWLRCGAWWWLRRRWRRRRDRRCGRHIRSLLTHRGRAARIPADCAGASLGRRCWWRHRYNNILVVHVFVLFAFDGDVARRSLRFEHGIQVSFGQLFGRFTAVIVIRHKSIVVVGHRLRLIDQRSWIDGRLQEALMLCV